MEKIGKYIIPGTPYRCKECWSRFWVFENPLRGRAVKIAGGFLACLLILCLAWFFWPRQEETSWQAVQRNVGAVPEPRPKEPATVASPLDLQSKTAQVKTDEIEAKSARIPEPPVSVHENGKTETPVIADRSETPADSGIISVPPIPVDVSKPASESGDKQDTPPDSTGKSGGEKTLQESLTDGIETAAVPDKKTEMDKESVPVLPETAKAVTPASDSGTSAPAGSEAPQEIRAEAGYAGSPQTGKKETDQAVTNTGTVLSVPQLPVPDTKTAPAKAVPESAPAVTISPAKAVPESLPDTKQVPAPASFRELKTVKSKSEKEAFEIHILADGPVSEHTFFQIKSQSPPKLVVDLPGKWKHRGKALFKVKDSMVYQVRVGLHPDFIRVVLDMKISGPLQPAFSETDQGLKVTLTRQAE